jgi:MraZ protein
VTEAWGASFVKLDDKKRVILPAKARAALAAGTYLTRGYDRCVFLFSKPQFDSHRERIKAQTPPDMPAIAFDRMFYSSVVTQDIDKQGRIVIPSALREYASLERELAIIAMDQRLELWDAANWQAYQDQYIEPYSQLGQGVR